MHFREEPVSLAALTGDAGEVTFVGVAAGETAAFATYCNNFAGGWCHVREVAVSRGSGIRSLLHDLEGH